MLLEPFYDPEKIYEENFAEGPFGAFTDEKVFSGHSVSTSKKYDFLGVKVNSPFGIPAGPLLNSNFCKGAFQNGFDIAVYKTVRSDVFPCHPFPNVLAVHIPQGVTLGKGDLKLVADTNIIKTRVM